ncbi:MULTISPECIES: DUF2528 family protein [unclassified Pseudomonas]|uniref:DUF2528 family protein n=1 Tax=unclassified Pseudomonas TaxID=196821 RepID=UPI001D1574FD|nr:MULTISPECIES: DUF2528 family protein [unclassified Pseudomonas]
MTNLKKHTLMDSWKDWSITLEVDHDILTIERATEINEFWTSAEERLSDEDGDVVMVVIKMAAKHLVYAFLEMGGGVCSDERAAGHWTRDNLQNDEGWGGTVKGSAFGWCGIRLVSADIEVDLNLEFRGE